MDDKVQDQQDWIEAYLELCKLISDEIPEIQHIDLWYDQLSYEKEEYPYPEKSLFIDFNIIQTQTIGIKAQDLMTQVSFIFAFDTLSDTHHKSDNQATALAFGKTIRKLHSVLQAKSGVNYSAMDRIGLSKQVAPESVLAYNQTYACIIRDYSAVDESVTADMKDIKPQVEKGEGPEPPDLKLFEVEM